MNHLKEHLVLAAAGTCFIFSVLLITSWMRHGVDSFQTIMCIVVVAGSAIVLMSRILSGKEK